MIIGLDGTTIKLSCKLLALHVTRKKTHTYHGHAYYDSFGASVPAANLFLTISDLYMSQSERSVEDVDMITAVYTRFVDKFKHFTTELYSRARGLTEAEIQVSHSTSSLVYISTTSSNQLWSNTGHWFDLAKLVSDQFLHLKKWSKCNIFQREILVYKEIPFTKMVFFLHYIHGYYLYVVTMSVWHR